MRPLNESEASFLKQPVRSSRGMAGGHREARSYGFTLLELVVVIAILGVVAGLVSLSAAPAEHRRVDEELDRLAALFRLAHDEARISGQTITWEADAKGYRFVTVDGVRGQADADDPLRPRHWAFQVRSVQAPILAFGREPLMVPARMHLQTSTDDLTLEINTFGEMTVLR